MELISIGAAAAVAAVSGVSHMPPAPMVAQSETSGCQKPTNIVALQAIGELMAQVNAMPNYILQPHVIVHAAPCQA